MHLGCLDLPLCEEVGDVSPNLLCEGRLLLLEELEALDGEPVERQRQASCVISFSFRQCQIDHERT